MRSKVLVFSLVLIRAVAAAPGLQTGVFLLWDGTQNDEIATSSKVESEVTSIIFKARYVSEPATYVFLYEQLVEIGDASLELSGFSGASWRTVHTLRVIGLFGRWGNVAAVVR